MRYVPRMTSIARSGGRAADALRPHTFQPGFLSSADGSCLAAFGGTRVLCTASISSGVPGWLEGRGEGWLTAEYAMLPASTGRRRAREGRKGTGVDGRTVEIQRLIGRVLRPRLDRKALGSRTITVDCDVLEADGGTRTTAINGAAVAIRAALARRDLSTVPFDPIGAISVGVVDGSVLLDLDYPEDARADADMNVVMDQAGNFLEVQASAEGRPFTRDEFDRALEVAAAGIERVFAAQQAALAADGGGA